MKLLPFICLLTRRIIYQDFTNKSKSILYSTFDFTLYYKTQCSINSQKLLTSGASVTSWIMVTVVMDLGDVINLGDVMSRGDVIVVAVWRQSRVKYSSSCGDILVSSLSVTSSYLTSQQTERHCLICSKYSYDMLQFKQHARDLHMVLRTYHRVIYSPTAVNA